MKRAHDPGVSRPAFVARLFPRAAAAQSPAQPRWRKSERFERVATFTVAAAPAEVFPLLCPVEEYKWLPGWSCRMCWSASGVAEKDAVFQTGDLHGLRKVVWTTITYEPPRLVEYLLVAGRDGVIRLSLSLAEAGGATALTWRMLFTATSPLGRRILPRRFSEPAFRHMMELRRRQLDQHLRREAHP